MERFKGRLSKRDFLKVFSIAVVGVGLRACESVIPTTPSVKEIPTAKPESKLNQIKTPFWNEEDFREVQRILKDGQYIESQVFLKDPNKKPPFYKNTQPFQYNAYYVDPYQMWILFPIAQDFRELGFLNVFLPPSLSSPVSKGARTLLEGGRLVAEARFLRFLEESKGFEVEEVHYGTDGKPIFWCKSQFDQNNYKVSQTETIGNKSADYYFVWPMLR